MRSLQTKLLGSCASRSGRDATKEADYSSTKLLGSPPRLN